MAENLVTINLPESIYQRLEQAATRLSKPVDAVLVETLDAALPGNDGLPPELATEIKAVEQLGKAELQQLITTDMVPDDQEALDGLLDTQSSRSLTPDETIQLEKLRREYERVLLRKARAFALLAGPPSLRFG
jgi:hypothetical protein